MNPTDQARKEARKRELKKNKKQRLMVRQAVLKGKDPMKLIEDMEVIDRLEFDPESPPKLAEKVLKDKRKKLKETFERVMRLYEKEEPEYALELQKALLEADKKRDELNRHYDQVKMAERVQLDQIPLPDALPSLGPETYLIPLPDMEYGMMMQDEPELQGILKHRSHGAYSSGGVVPPGPPPGLPPSLRARLRNPPGPPPGDPPHLSDSDADEPYDPESAILETMGPLDLASVPMPPGPPSGLPPGVMPLGLPPGPPPGLPRPPGVDDGDEPVGMIPPPPPPQKSRKIRFEDDATHDPESEEKDSRPKLKPAVSAMQVKLLQMAGQVVPMKPADDGVESPPPLDEDEDRDSDKDRERRRRSRRDRRKRSYSSDSSSSDDDDDRTRRRRKERDRRDRGDRDRSRDKDRDRDRSRDRDHDKKKDTNNTPAAMASLLPTSLPTGGPGKPDVAPPGVTPPAPPPGLPQRAGPTAPSGNPPSMPPGPPPGLPPMMFRPPPLRAPSGGPPRMLPPGPPPGRPPGIPPGPPPGLPPNIRPGPPQRLPPGPPRQPAGMPPQRMRAPPLGGPANIPLPGSANPNVLSAPPSIRRPGVSGVTPLSKQPSATISAKPQIKHTIGDNTRFMPTALRVKREIRDAKGRIIKAAPGKEAEASRLKAGPVVPAPTKDDAYDTFMKEMENFL